METGFEADMVDGRGATVAVSLHAAPHGDGRQLGVPARYCGYHIYAGIVTAKTTADAL